MTGVKWKCCFCGNRRDGSKLAWLNHLPAPTHAMCEDCIDRAARALAEYRAKSRRSSANLSNGLKARSGWWTADRVALLRALWAAGDSARQIAEQLGTTRYAVIGKANTLGLPVHARYAGGGWKSKPAEAAA